MTNLVAAHQAFREHIASLIDVCITIFSPCEPSMHIVEAVLEHLQPSLYRIRHGLDRSSGRRSC